MTYVFSVHCQCCHLPVVNLVISTSHFTPQNKFLVNPACFPEGYFHIQQLDRLVKYSITVQYSLLQVMCPRMLFVCFGGYFNVCLSVCSLCCHITSKLLFSERVIVQISGIGSLLHMCDDLTDCQVMNNPALIRQVMENPMVQQIMSNPEIMRQMMLSNPQMRELMEVGFHWEKRICYHLCTSS